MTIATETATKAAAKQERRPVSIEVTRDDLVWAVAWAARALPLRPTLPVLAGLRLRAGGGQLAVEAFDYDTSASAVVTAAVGDDHGQILVPGRLLAEIVKALPARPVTITDDGVRATLRCGAAVFNMGLLPDGEYPTLPEMPAAAGSTGAALFAAAVAQVVGAAGTDDTLPALTGVKVVIDGPRVTMVATDRYRLAVRELEWDPADPAGQAEILLSAKTISDVARAMTSETTVDVFLGVDGPGIGGFAAGRRRLTTRLLSGEFPKYRTLIPTEFRATADLAGGPLAEAVKLAALACERGTPVRLTFAGGELEIAGGAGDEAQALDVLTGDDVIFDGDDMQVAFNPQYLLNAIAGCGGGPLRISFVTAAKPALLTSTEAPGYEHLLMPIRSAV